jgi:hypothetical protein
MASLVQDSVRASRWPVRTSHFPPSLLVRVIPTRTGFSQERFGNVDSVRSASRRKVRRAATTKYEIYSGRRVVSTRESVSALHAVVDFVRAYGVKDEEILRLGVDSVAWRGARFRAVPVDETSGST